MEIPVVMMIVVVVVSLIAPPSKAVTIYDVLRSHELPTGLFPIGITNFTLNPPIFHATLNQSCIANLKPDHVHYNPNLSGTITHGRIANLSGVSAQDLFLWFPVNSIRVDFPTSGLIHFDVGGVVRKHFSLSLFETPPPCTLASLPYPTVTSPYLLHTPRSSSVDAQKQAETIGSEQEGDGTVLRSAS